MNNIIPYLTAITGIILAYLAFRHQQRLKAFELFYSRRAAVLTDIEAQLEKLFAIQKRLTEGKDDELADCQNRFFHDGLVLYHKIRGANFGDTAEILADSYFSLIQESLGKGSALGVESWLHRSSNILSMLYGVAHSYLSYQIEILTMPMPLRCLRHAERWLERRRAKGKINVEFRKAKH
ncbi:MAG: hypothetical protein U1G08_07995 [Verrucomicrobiota bacterium]